MALSHILIPLPDFHAGGLEFVALRLAEKWVASGHKVTILAGANDGQARDRVAPGIDVQILSPAHPRAPFSMLTLGRPIAAAARALAPDIIFIPGNFHLLGRWLRAALPDALIVAKISNPLLLSPMSSPALSWVMRPVLRAVTAGIDWFVALSSGLADEARRQLGHQRVSAIINPSAEDGAPFFDSPRPPVPPEETLRMLLVGRLEHQKDISLALQTVEKLPPNRPAHLRICGDGSMRPQIEREIVDRGLTDNVTLVGFTDDVTQEFEQAQLLLITSHFEGGPAVGPEAVAHGVPVVSTNCSHFITEFLSEPSLGMALDTRSPDDLAKAVIKQAQKPGPDPDRASTALRPLRQSTSAANYLALFERLKRGRAGRRH